MNVAAEAHASVLLSQASYEVAMQYGTTQLHWNIIAKKGVRTLAKQLKGRPGRWLVNVPRPHATARRVQSHCTS
jgi:3-methyladenine DNA glycosylase AlkC